MAIVTSTPKDVKVREISVLRVTNTVHANTNMLQIKGISSRIIKDQDCFFAFLKTLFGCWGAVAT